MNLNRVKRTERLERTRTAMDSREKEAEKKRHDRINGNLDYMKEQKKQKEKSSPKEQNQGDNILDNKEKTKRTDINNESIHTIKEQMESRNAGGIQRLRDRMQRNTTGTIRAVKEDMGKAIGEYEKNFEIEDDGAR